MHGGGDFGGVVIDPRRLVFEERVKMNCFYCGKYNSSWRCPPRIPPVDFAKMFGEYEKAALLYVRKKVSAGNYDAVRAESSVELHRMLLLCERYLWEKGNATAISFIGGSCKLCKGGCNPSRCANPYQSRSPVEALGINVVKSARRFGIAVDFPPGDSMVRVGMLLW